jgi:hypothetical protein
MARLIPDDLDESLITAFAKGGEWQTLKQLRDGLADDLTVYHSVHWASATGSGSVYGEIDFIVVNRYGKLLAIEQKDASVYVSDGDLKVDYEYNKGKSIRVQVSRNIGALRSEFGRRHQGCDLSVDHLLYLPNARVSDRLPAGVDPSRVVDASTAQDLCAVIQSLFDNAPMPTGEKLADPIAVHDFLAERVQAVPHIGLLGQTARMLTSRVSGGLATWVSRLSISPHRLHIKGTAGSGKTQLALQELRLAADNVQQALYLCYNRPLADAVKAVAPSSAYVMTIHEFARELGQQAGLTFDFSLAGVYDQMIEALQTHASKLTDTFDVLVIDEGQDMDATWIEALLPMVKDNGRVTLLEDPEQSLYERSVFEPTDWPVIESPVNYRSPRTLVAFMNHFELTDKPIEAGGGLIGFDPVWHWYTDSKTLLDETELAVKTLMDQGYAPENIAILTYQGLANSLLFAKDAPRGLNKIALKRQDGYDSEGQARFTNGQILVETLYRFKGQAADAIIVTEIDFEGLDQKNRRKLFVAFSRARLHLVFITSERARDALLALTRSD